jgi:hypothetical protein
MVSAEGKFMTSNNLLTGLWKILSGSRLAFLALVLAGGYFLWAEHQAHLLAALPFLILLLCPLLHVFMHGGHGGHRKSGGTADHEPHRPGRDAA